MTAVVRATTYNYLSAITELTVDTLPSNTKNQYILSWTQVCKNTAEYSSKPTTTYTTTVKLYLNSDDRTLDGVYTTDGASATSSSANVNDQTIGLVLSELYYGTTRRLLRTDSISTFVINKEPDGRYSIGECTLYFTAAAPQDRGKNTYIYNYCYAEEEILNQGIEPTPYIFSYEGGYHAEIHHYDMDVNGISVTRDDNEYGTIRYFLTLNCTGKNRESGSERNYEVQLAIYPTAESIVGSFSTQGSGELLYASKSYIRDLKIDKTRYLANDSLSIIRIASRGAHQYSFFGGTMICTDLDVNYSAVYGKNRVSAVHYFHFNDHEGQGVEFEWNENDKEVALSPYKVSVEAFTVGGEITHYDMLVYAKDSQETDYEVSLSIENSVLDGTFRVEDETLSLWSSVNFGKTYSYISSGSTVTIQPGTGTTHTLSGSLTCENAYTYLLQDFEFKYPDTPTGISNQPSAVRSQKILREGVLLIERNGVVYNAQGGEVKGERREASGE